MPEPVIQALWQLIHGLEIIGANVLVLGFVFSTIRWLVDTSRHGAIEAVEGYRKTLGRSVVIGLEILVATTIIKTITLEPTIGGMSLLSCMIAIRMTLGWAMALELGGRWPWQKAYGQ